MSVILSSPGGAPMSPNVTDVLGFGYATVAIILGEVGAVRRFPSKHPFATYPGTAPLAMS
ncbi:MAG: IS110 family transposase [Actinomycetota bacterium]|nr:IS110 family transposase [Actinomycetota bacterium]